MNKHLYSLLFLPFVPVLLTACRPASSADKGDLRVALRGRSSECRVVIPTDGTPCHRNAAEEFVRWAEGVSGVRLAMALWLANAEIGNIYDQFQRFLGILTGGLGCLFFMGVFMKKVNGFGATCGLVANYIICFGLDIAPIPGKPHVLFFGFLGMVACLIVSPIASLLKGKEN